MEKELIDTLKQLRLGGLLAHWDEYLTLAQRRRFSHVRLLRHILEEEVKIKHANARLFRLRRAMIPELLELTTFPFNRQPNLDRKKIIALFDGFNYMTDAQNIIWFGPTGCGKTGLATGFLIQAINRGYTGRFVTFPKLINELFSATADHSEEKVIKRYLAYDCLLIDEIGYIEVEPAQTGQFFNLMQRRHRHKPTLITSNPGFDEWRSFLKNDHLAAALIDRLTENSHVINMKNCKSLRPKLCQ
jgi:DNA replication protein DnaC